MIARSSYRECFACSTLIYHLNGSPDDRDNWSSQHWWMRLLNTADRQNLLRTSADRDSARLKCLNTKLSGAWVGCIPSQHLGLKIGNVEFINLVKFRLGIPIMPADMAGAACPRCDAAVDIFGDHFLVCKQAGFWFLVHLESESTTVCSGDATSATLPFCKHRFIFNDFQYTS